MNQWTFLICLAGCLSTSSNSFFVQKLSDQNHKKVPLLSWWNCRKWSAISSSKCWSSSYALIYSGITFNHEGLFRFFPPSPTDKIIISPPPLADMLSWAVWFKFLLSKVIANTCLFILTSFSKQSASWKVLEICELCALSTDSRKTYSVNKYMHTGSSSYSFDWGGGGEIIRWGGRNGKDPNHEVSSFLHDV